MRSDWEKRNIGSLCTITRGASPRPIHNYYTDKGIPWIKISDATASNSRYIEKTTTFIQESGRSKSVEVFFGDLIVSNSATPALPRIVGLNACIHDGWLLLRNFKDFDKMYACYLIDHIRPQLLRLGNGSVFTNLKTEILKDFEIPLPPLAEQKRIAALLGSLDDLIENNRKMNEVLEEMAQAIFKSWFIDFDGVPEEDLVESELGLIPLGWEVKPITSLIQLNPRLKVNKDRMTKYIDMKALSTNSCEITSFIEREFQGGGSKFENGDTLLARITPCLENGKTAFVSLLDKGEIAVGSTEFIVLRATDKVCAEWVYCLARSNTFRSFAISNMTGSSGRQRVPDNCFSNFHMPEPNSDIMFRFKELTESLFQQIASNQKKIQTLSELRDTLLPKLISGELRIPEAEKIVEDLL